MNSQNIQLAKYAGFCYGVKRAVETAKKLKQAYNAGISSYIAEGIATALIAVGLSKAKDIVVDLINKDKSKKATKKED